MSAATLAPTPASQPSTSSAASASSHIDNAGATTEKEGLQAPDISSPHQLIDWVDTVLGQLETRFDDMNGQVTARSENHRIDLVYGAMKKEKLTMILTFPTNHATVNEMSSRIDALESSIQDLIHGTLAPAGASTPNDA